MSPFRDNAVRLATAYVGCTQEDPATWLDLLMGPNDAGLESYFLDQKTSSCALVVRGFWRRLDIQHPRLDKRYVSGKAVEDVVQIAKDLNAWVTPTIQVLPQAGDWIVDTANEHVWTVSDSGPGTYRGVDGGQRTSDFKHQAIKEVTREILWDSGSLWDHPDGHPSRRLLGWVDCDRLFL